MNETGVRITSADVKNGLFRLQAEQWVDHPRPVVFSFFSDASNLELLTPPWLQFRILDQNALKMHEGAIIDYRIKVHGIPLRWRSEITVWEPAYRFVDKQRVGPYRTWKHEHSFVEQDGGTTMRDLVTYGVAGPGWLEHHLVRPDLFRIFQYRQNKLKELFRPQPAGSRTARHA